jgi:hypothetical protein
MTALAVRTKFSVVHIIGTMAFTTSHSELDHVSKRLAMAVVAGNGYMRTIELKICLQVMIEKPDLPVHRVVAALAGRAEPALVRIIVTVAINTRAPGITEHL